MSGSLWSWCCTYDALFSITSSHLTRLLVYSSSHHECDDETDAFQYLGMMKFYIELGREMIKVA
jgi:hypothetical protein